MPTSLPPRFVPPPRRPDLIVVLMIIVIAAFAILEMIDPAPIDAAASLLASP